MKLQLKNILIILIFLNITNLNAIVRMKQIRTLNFGQVPQGDTKVLTIPINCATANSDANIGKIQFDHTRNDKNTVVTIDWSTPSTLDNGLGDTLTFTNSESWCDESTTGTTYDITGWGSGTYTGLGTNNRFHNIYWGGYITVPITSPAGIYSGTINITITY